MQAAILIERGKLSWKTTVGEIYLELVGAMSLRRIAMRCSAICAPSQLV